MMWSEAYRAACEELSVEVREDVSSASESGELVVWGNSFDCFTHRMTDRDVEALLLALRSCPCLSLFQLPYHNISDEGGLRIGKALPQGLSGVVTLDVRYNALGVQAGVAIAEGLQQNDSVSCLILSGNPLSGRCGTGLGEALRHNRTLTVLDLFNTELDMPALVHICRSLEENAHLASLNIGRPLLHGDDEVENVVNHLSVALQRNSTLEALHVGHFGLTDRSLQTLVLALCGSSVTTLDIKGNKVSQDGGLLLARLLDRRHDFRSLDMSYNRLRDAGARELSSGMAHHPQLESLALSNCSIGEEGLMELVGALKSCSKLRRLFLWGNDVTPTVASALATAFSDLCEMESTDVGIAERGGQWEAFQA